MLTRCRIIWNRLCSAKNNLKLPPFGIIRVLDVKRKNPAITYTIAFSLFTWLGFENKKNSAEDDLIQTIRHCVLFIQNKEYEKAEQLLHVALREAQQLNHQIGITYIYDVMANLALEREQLDKAKQLFVAVTQRIMSDGAKEDDPRVVHISAKLARISHLKKEYSTAQLGYDWCLDKLKSRMGKIDDNATKICLAVTEDWYGRLFLDHNQNEQGLLLMLSALDWMKQVPEVEQEQIILQMNDIGTVYERLGKLDESINYIKQAIALGSKINMPDLGALHVNLGRAYLKKDLIVEARKSCGFGWKLGVIAKNDDIKKEAEACIQEIKNHS